MTTPLRQTRIVSLSDAHVGKWAPQIAREVASMMASRERKDGISPVLVETTTTEGRDIFATAVACLVALAEKVGFDAQWAADWQSIINQTFAPEVGNQ